MSAAKTRQEEGRGAWGVGVGCLLCACLTILGCATSRRPTDEAGRAVADSTIVELNLLAMPVALNLDKSPGADGFAVKVYAVTRGDPKPQPIGSGRLDLLMFDGDLSGRVSETNQARRVWSYSDRELSAFLFQTAIGAGYAFTARWGQDTPKQDRITVVARYTPPRGPSIYSASSVITVVSQ